MAEVEKFTDSAMIMVLKHSERELKIDSNTDIVSEKKELNYSIELDHKDQSDREYYKQLVGDSFLYGRGSNREANAVTCCSWVITLPKGISDYSKVAKNDVSYLNPNAEKQFFKSAVEFISNRYGKENIVHAKVHYDEGGQPHVHVYFVPRKELNHDFVHFKTESTKHAIQTESGRWEYEVKFKVDGNGDRIPLKNYSRMSDYYDQKLAAAEIINRAELQHFHPDFAKFLKDNNLPGADYVHTGVTGGKNISVSAMKEFTRTVGMTVDQAKELVQINNVLAEKVVSLEATIKNLSMTLAEKDKEITNLKKEIEIDHNHTNGWGQTDTWNRSREWGNIDRNSVWNVTENK